MISFSSSVYVHQGHAVHETASQDEADINAADDSLLLFWRESVDVLLIRQVRLLGDRPLDLSIVGLFVRHDGTTVQQGVEIGRGKKIV